ncbi:IS630 transposase-related protein, partial [Okeania sp.]
MSYSLDLRTRVIDYIENGGSILSASRIYKV